MSRPYGATYSYACFRCFTLINSNSFAESASCPICGHSEFKEWEPRDHSFATRSTRVAQKEPPVRSASYKLRPDAKAFIAGQSTFIILGENSISNNNIIRNIARYFGGDVFIGPGVFTDPWSGENAVGFFVDAHRPLTIQEMSYLRRESSGFERGSSFYPPSLPINQSSRLPFSFQNFNGGFPSSVSYQQQAGLSHSDHVFEVPQRPYGGFLSCGGLDTRNSRTVRSFHGEGNSPSDLTLPQPNLPYSEFPPAKFSEWDEESLRKDRLLNFMTDENSPRYLGLDGNFAKTSPIFNSGDLATFNNSECPTHHTGRATHAITNASEHGESLECVNLNAADTPCISCDVSTLDIRSDDTRILEPLDARYLLMIKPQRYFKIGRVFMTHWSEPASPTVRDGPHVSTSGIGGRIYSETKRFVVMHKGPGYSLCSPIQTYRKQGTTKSRLSLENHAIVYAAGSEPILLPKEQTPGMGSFPIVLEDKFVTIDPSSRLNFGKVYTVEHNIKVRNVGRVDREWLPRLRTALLRSMGVGMLETEIETETEDDVSTMS